MTEPYFVDSNVLVYAFDAEAGRRHETAAALVQRGWEDQCAVISTQVLQEFYDVVTRRLKKPMSPTAARSAVAAFGAWQVEVIRVPTIIQAASLAERYRIAFWDGLIIAAAAQGGTRTLLTEDLQDGALIGGVRIRNPFE
jgi:predicted nucleic acid-binding protein